ncbi:putative mitochondrial respiratory complex I chaperone (Cia84) [Aspergillus saccharolyticus JOP 1030-1]|uniref:Mitochondrial respiratory complex I chaperone n=1 Tax=Aspergillus saccharolyticus JOP 1030-1 TaxID=1450539 RepID=A0A318ZM46_9EURO|nr:hypothetical protein BP01DRAFT_335220 [Aspergillus saccharolyticus JOP 1030-1]PYH47735.1 hypothetical protein BP01DRAFT_335220 [Aspergillus saccharolyticus JOP 1030-1]
MQSHLTRRVFRAILNNEPLSTSRCLHRSLHTVRSHLPRRITFLSLSHKQRRGLFAYNAIPTASAQPATLPSEIGLKPMRDLMRSISDKSRGPSFEILANAFNDFLDQRAAIPGVITDFHATLLSVTWHYMRTHAEELNPEEWQRTLSTEALENMLFVLSQAKCLHESQLTVRELAHAAFSELCRDPSPGMKHISRSAFIAYINIQALNGRPDEAREVLERFWFRLKTARPTPWHVVIKGFAIVGEKRRLEQTVKNLEKFDVEFEQKSHEDLVKLLIQERLLAATKTIYECPLSNGQTPTVATKEAVIKYAILNSETAWAQSVYESLSHLPVTQTLGITLFWEAVQKQSASAVSDKASILMAGDELARTALTISCVNDLIEYANAIENPGLAAKFAVLASHWGLEPDARTQLLQLESSILAGDIGGAFSSMEDLHDPEALTVVNMPLMNKLVRLLCRSGQDDAIFDRISAFLDPLFENNVRLEASTVAAITRMLLYRLDWEGVSGLLRPRLGLYDSEERTIIRNSLAKFIMEPSQKDTDAWEAYNLLLLAFPETGVILRTNIMTSFFKRHRSDLAYLVFGHMRQAEDFARRPKPDTYARCFVGIARTRSVKHLQLVHNMLKLDVEVDLTTRVLNGLMLAYAYCDMPEQAMKVFRDILQSDEGPSPKTIRIFFETCARHNNGVDEALKMMDKVKLLGIERSRQLYMTYVKALAAHCEFDLATEALEKMETETGFTPTRNSIGEFYNTIPYQHWKDEVEKWARARFPELWAQLEQVERTEHDEGQQFSIETKEIDVETC